VTTVGDALPPLTVQIRREDLVRYAGASGDFNQIHWSGRVAVDVGLPGVIAHGMLTMALATRLVTSWLDDPARLLDVSVRFTKPVLVPDDDTGATVEFTGVVAAIDPAEDGDGETARIDLTATCGGQRVLAQARATVRLP
jgi:acyl dehydratase